MGFFDWFKKADGRTLSEQAEEVFRSTGTIPRELRLDLIAVYGCAIQDMKGMWSSTAVLPASKAIMGEAILQELCTCSPVPVVTG